MMIYTKAGDIAQCIKCLLCRHKDSSLVSRTHFENLGVVACTCNPREAESGKALGLPGQPA